MNPYHACITRYMRKTGMSIHALTYFPQNVSLLSNYGWPMQCSPDIFFLERKGLLRLNNDTLFNLQSFSHAMFAAHIIRVLIRSLSCYYQWNAFCEALCSSSFTSFHGQYFHGWLVSASLISNRCPHIDSRILKWKYQSKLLDIIT